MRLRHLLGFAAALAVLSAVAWLQQGTPADSDPVLSSAGPPVVPAPPVVVAAPVAPAAATGAAPAWVRRTAAAAGIPEPAVAAYGAAVLGQPGCDLGWTTLAGIGWVESHHGTIGERTLDASGHPSTPILGPALDGDGVAAIRASAASAALHGDPSWDHAMGPLQFIPSTWATWGRDGDADGVADPQDLDDAAAAAAAYLCGAGYDLSTGAGWSAAVFAYNHSADYVSAVYDAAAAYASRTS